ncbi:sporulation protein [Streptomyces sp. SCSIO 30461]|uniref:sporulation protein n=1 Tax=Streptomyces sp. SCSIO 30461 TaxID=3118085 RepID=UPI0030CCB7C3
MVFKKLLGSLGVGGPAVDTVLDPGAVLPGGTLSGHVHLKGGNADFDIDHITLELVAHIEAERDHGESEGTFAFGRLPVAAGFRLGEGEHHSVPFAIIVPWEMPITELYGQPLGIMLGVRTELSVAGAKDKGDLDLLAVRPLPVQEAILEALGQLGFGFKSADLEYGHIHGTGQQLPFYQEIELAPAPQYAHAMHELEITFLATPGGMEIVLEADKPGGFFSSGHDVVNRHVVSHDGVAHRDWTTPAQPAGQRHHPPDDLPLLVRQVRGVEAGPQRTVPGVSVQVGETVARCREPEVGQRTIRNTDGSVRHNEALFLAGSA